MVNNAGIEGPYGPIAGLSTEDFRRVMDINLTSPFVLAREAVPHLRRTRGNVVFVASVFGLRPEADFAAYNCSKAAVEMLARTLAREEAAAGVRSNSVSPGFVCTDMTVSSQAADFKR